MAFKLKRLPDLSQRHLSRFMSSVQPDSGGCWNWLGSRYRSGYGYIGICGVKYRAARQCGERHGRSKLSAEDVTEIRQARGGRGLGRELSQRFRVSPSLVTLIRKRKVWKHVAA